MLGCGCDDEETTEFSVLALCGSSRNFFIVTEGVSTEDLSLFMKISLEERFWSKVSKSEGCWKWQGAFRSDGYGKINKEGKSHSAHRISWEITNGPIPEGLWVLHKCDNPPCVNPKHLFLGTAADNMADKMAKGRDRYVPHIGEDNPRCKLTVEKVKEIRASDMTCNQLSELYGVTDGTISAIRTRKLWKHIAL